MTQPSPLTREEHLQAQRQSAALKFWFACRWLHEHSEETFRSVLRQRIDIIRMTPYFDPARMNGDRPDFDTPGWLRLEDALADRYERLAADAFQRAAADLLDPILYEGLGRSYAAFCQAPAMKCGSLTYHAIDPANPRVIAIHIANALRPRSPFDDPGYLPDCLLGLMDRAEAEFGVDQLHCGTWLNSHPRWLALFPAEWQERLSPPDGDIQWHLGFWGQFITARGDFHAKNATAFRRTGAMPFAFRTSTCAFAALRNHLRALTP